MGNMHKRRITWSGWLMGLWMWCAAGLSLQAATVTAGDTTSCTVASDTSYLSESMRITPPNAFPHKMILPFEAAMWR